MIGSSALDDKILTDPSVASAIHTFSALSLDSLKDIYESVKGTEQLRCVFLRKGFMVIDVTESGLCFDRILFIEVLPLTGSNPAALMVKDLILEDGMTEFVARRAIAYVPFYLRLPSEKLLSSYEELLQDSRIENK